MENKDIQLFEDQPIRTAWDGEREEWYFAVVDVIGVLTDSKDPAAYWRKLKQRLRQEGNQTVTDCHALKMTAATKPMGMQESREVARQGDAVAGNARRELEERTGSSVISSANAAQLNDVAAGMITDIAKDPKKD